MLLASTGTSGIRTHTHRGLSSAAIPVRASCRCFSDFEFRNSDFLRESPVGFEPTISTVAGSRALRCSTRTICSRCRQTAGDVKQPRVLANAAKNMMRKPWDSNPRATESPPVFQTGSSSGRLASVILCHIGTPHRRRPIPNPAISVTAKALRRDRCDSLHHHEGCCPAAKAASESCRRSS